MVAFCHMSKEVVTRATEKQGAASVDRSGTGAVDQSWGVAEEARAGPMEQPRPAEGRGRNQLMARWAQQLHRSLTQACPKTGAPGRGLAPHCPSLRSRTEPGPRSGGSGAGFLRETALLWVPSSLRLAVFTVVPCGLPAGAGN